MQRLTNGWPVWLTFVVLFLGAVVRGAATYAVGAGLRSGGSRSRLGRHLDRPSVLRAQRWVQRWGAPVVALGFLTIGVQSAINAAAGLLRMPLPRFGVGLFFGALLWAGLYTTVGFAVMDALLGTLSWWAAAAALLAVGASWLVSKRLAARSIATGD